MLSARSETSTIPLFRAVGSIGMKLSLDADGRGSVRLSNPNKTDPAAGLEIADKGSHIRLERPGGASGYLFVNDAGVVPLDRQCRRKLALVAPANGEAIVQRFDSDGKLLP